MSDKTNKTGKDNLRGSWLCVWHHSCRKTRFKGPARNVELKNKATTAYVCSTLNYITLWGIFNQFKSTAEICDTASRQRGRSACFPQCVLTDHISVFVCVCVRTLEMPLRSLSLILELLESFIRALVSDLGRRRKCTRAKKKFKNIIQGIKGWQI